MYFFTIIVKHQINLLRSNIINTKDGKLKGISILKFSGVVLINSDLY